MIRTNIRRSAFGLKLAGSEYTRTSAVSLRQYATCVEFNNYKEEL